MSLCDSRTVIEYRMLELRGHGYQCKMATFVMIVSELFLDFAGEQR